MSEHQEHEDSEQDERLDKEYSRVLRVFFKLDKSKIQALAEAFNENGANISIGTVSKIIGLDITDASYVKGSMLYHAHNKIHHSSEVRSRMSFLDKDTLENIIDFFENKLNAKGVEGLSKAHTAAASISDEDFIDESGFKIEYQDITDENNNLIGFMPLIRFRIKTYGKEGANELFFSSTVEQLGPTLDVFAEHRKRVLEKIKKDKKALGDLLIFAGDEEI